MMSLKSYSVLAADDEFWVRENLRSLIDWGKHGFIFLEPAADGADALSRIEKEKPDIVISDVNMPHMSGTELIEKCVESFPGTVFIALSGYNDYHFVRSTLVGGAIDYLLKPIGEAELITVLGKAVDKLADRSAHAQSRTDALELKRQASMLALDREYSSYLKSVSESDDHAMLTGRLAEYELEYSGYALALFNAPRLFSKANAARPLGAEQTICTIKDIIDREAGGSKRLVFHNTQKTSEFILITDMRIHRLKEVCRALLPKLSHATGLTLTAVISRYYYSFASLAKAYSEATLALLCKPFINKPMVISSADRDNSINLTRVTPDIEKRLAQAISGRRSFFEDILFREVGLKTLPAEKWLYGEMRQAAATASWILRTGERNQAKLLVLDSLSEILMKAVDSFDRDEALDILDQMIQERFPQSEHPRQSEGIESVVYQAREYIDDNYFEDDLSLSTLSDRFHVENSYLSRAFKKSTGVNLTFYITRVRVTHAKEYLAEGLLSIKEISQLVGYGDYAYFSRIFRKVTGVSPKYYSGQKEGGAGEIQ